MKFSLILLIILDFFFYFFFLFQFYSFCLFNCFLLICLSYVKTFQKRIISFSCLTRTFSVSNNVNISDDMSLLVFPPTPPTTNMK
ncbi:hypothetical protein BRADI_1g41003v3 [Brachypodium distachyon]|uniref:Uncharacterized protein n=1 Tax=Brachypodium distachyon TaxID=15368 RepID=A0A2K2DNP3_BRADI|nr:hypothetical protein BRADI_1g41003v3 [Brachypodium distachyon]